MTDFVEMFRHWNARRSQVQIYEALNVDRKTIRKFLARRWPRVCNRVLTRRSTRNYGGHG